MKETTDILSRVKASESTICLGDFTAYLGNDVSVWKGVIGRHGDVNLSDNTKPLLLVLQQSCKNGVCVMNKVFEYKDSHMYTWCKNRWANVH